MDEKLLQKMIQKCFLQYNHDLDTVPLSKKEYQELIAKINTVMETEKSATLTDIINDQVYEYLTK